MRVAWLAGVDDRLDRSGAALVARAPGPAEPGEPGMRRARALFVVGQQTARDSVAAAAVLRPARSSVRGGLLLCASRSPLEQTAGVDCGAGASSTDDDRSPASGLAARRQA